MGSPLQARDFALYVGATVATAFAIEMSFVAIGWQVYSIDRDPLDLGIVGLAMFLPLPLLALPAGHLADRYPRRTILAVAIGLDAAVAVGLLLVTRAGADETWPFFALAFATGVASALGSPAGRALTPSLVPQEILVQAFAQRSVAFQLSVIGGPALGGLLFAIRRSSSTSCPRRSRCSPSRACSRSAPVATAPARARPISGACSAACASCAGRPSSSAPSRSTCSRCFRRRGRPAAGLRKDVLEVGPAGLGVLRAAPAAGALVAAVVLTRRPIRRNAGRTLFTVVALYGLTMIVFGLSETMWLSLLALAAGGGVDMVSVVLRQTILPLVTPDELRGRVTAVEMVFISASNELGAFESGVAAALIGAVPAVVIGGALTIAVAVTWTRVFPGSRGSTGSTSCARSRPCPERPSGRRWVGRHDVVVAWAEVGTIIATFTAVIGLQTFWSPGRWTPCGSEMHRGFDRVEVRLDRLEDRVTRLESRDPPTLRPV